MKRLDIARDGRKITIITKTKRYSGEFSGTTYIKSKKYIRLDAYEGVKRIPMSAIIKIIT